MPSGTYAQHNNEHIFISSSVEHDANFVFRTMLPFCSTFHRAIIGKWPPPAMARHCHIYVWQATKQKTEVQQIVANIQKSGSWRFATAYNNGENWNHNELSTKRWKQISLYPVPFCRKKNNWRLSFFFAEGILFMAFFDWFSCLWAILRLFNKIIRLRAVGEISSIFTSTINAGARWKPRNKEEKLGAGGTRAPIFTQVLGTLRCKQFPRLKMELHPLQRAKCVNYLNHIWSIAPFS